MQQAGGLGPEEAAALRAALGTAEARAAAAEAKVSDDAALIAHLKLEIAKLRRDRFDQRSERTQRLLDQYELQLEELEAYATVDELRAEMAAAKTTTIEAFTRRRPSRQPFPEHLPRERMVVPGPASCSCCGGARLSKLGEDVTETLEVIPRQWKVVQTVRERFSCRDCERISQAPAPGLPISAEITALNGISGDGRGGPLWTTGQPPRTQKGGPSSAPTWPPFSTPIYSPFVGPDSLTRGGVSGGHVRADVRSDVAWII